MKNSLHISADILPPKEIILVKFASRLSLSNFKIVFDESQARFIRCSQMDSIIVLKLYFGSRITLHPRKIPVKVM